MSQNLDNLLEGDLSARAKKKKQLLSMSAFNYFQMLDQEANRIEVQKKRQERAFKEATRKKSGF